MVEGEKGSVQPYQVGYTTNPVQCQRCRSFDMEEAECEMFEELNTKLPSIWDLDCSVKPNACCNAWNALPQPAMGEP